MEGAPELGPSTLGEDRIDVTFKVEEQNRNQFTFGGGVSGLEGTFLNASFSTANFLGLGETVQLSAQTGARAKNYQLALTEPYLFDRPITAGIDLYSRKLDYLTTANVVGYTITTDGGARLDPRDMSWDEARIWLDNLVEQDGGVGVEKKASQSKPGGQRRR